MRQLRGFLAVSAVLAVLSVAVVPLAAGAAAKPSVSLRVKPASVRVGERIRFSGLVRHAVTGDTTVRLWQVIGKKAKLRKTGGISSSGAYWFSARGARAGACVFRVTYRAGTTTYTSNTIRFTIAP